MIPPWSSASALLEDQRKRAASPRVPFLQDLVQARPQEAPPLDEAATASRAWPSVRSSDPQNGLPYRTCFILSLRVLPFRWTQANTRTSAHRHHEGTDERANGQGPGLPHGRGPCRGRGLGRTQRPHILFLQQALCSEIPSRTPINSRPIEAAGSAPKFPTLTVIQPPGKSRRTSGTTDSG